MRKRDHREMPLDLYCSLQAVNLSPKRRPGWRLKASSPGSPLPISRLSQCSSLPPSCSLPLRSAMPNRFRPTPPGVSSTVSVPLRNSQQMPRLTHAHGQAGAHQADSSGLSTTASTTSVVRLTSGLRGKSTSRSALRRSPTAGLKPLVPRRPARRLQQLPLTKYTFTAAGSF